MENRLVPINGLIALLSGEGGWPAALAEQGFRRHVLEAPIPTNRGAIRADAVIYRVDPVLILAVETKSGRNLEEEQARRYNVIDGLALRRGGALPAAVARGDRVEVRPLFVALEEHRGDVTRQLASLGIHAPLLTVSGERAQLTDTGRAPGLEEFDVRHGAGVPPARIPVDHQSPVEELRELLAPQLVAAQARRQEFVTVSSLCEQILPEWPILSAGGQRDFVRRVEHVLRAVTARLHDQFRLEPATSSMSSRVSILRTPASLRPQGRTQGWQAQERRFAEALGRGHQQPEAEQLSLDDLAQEGGLADE